MKASTLQNRIDTNLRTKGGEIAKKYANVERVLLGDRYHGTGYSGSGRYVSCKNGDYFSVIDGLRKIGVDFVEGNDAPRGGWCGQYVELSKKGKRQVAEWAKIRRAEIAKAEADRKAAIEAKREAKREAIKQQLEIINNKPSGGCFYRNTKFQRALQRLQVFNRQNDTQQDSFSRITTPRN